MKSKIKKMLRRALLFTGIEFSRGAVLQSMLRQELATLRQTIKEITPENPALHGFKCYSQFDEDGIIEQLSETLGIKNGCFVEFGCGNGLENNTHLLLMKGWRGLWVDGSPVNAAFIRANLPCDTKRLAFESQFVSLDNISDIVAKGLAQIQASDIDLLNMDLDGNDAYFLEELLKRWQPKIIVAEYNGKLPFGLKLTVPYNEKHWRTGDDFFGASLSELIDRLKGYRLVCCGLSGVNSYFIRNDLADAFPNYDPRDLYQPARVHLTLMSVGSPASLKFLAAGLQQSPTVEANTSGNSN